MSRTIPLVALLAFFLQTTAAWSAAPPNPTDSDANGNTAGGTDALDALTTGLSNTAFGYHGLVSNTGGSFNTAVGALALSHNTTGNQNTACGRSALRFNTDGINNTASGAFALYSNTSGGLNTASGVSALLNNTTGSRNTAVGYQALSSNTTASDNTATGTALGSNTTGSKNTASGAGALGSNTIGNFNTASGGFALQGNISGIKNTALGYEALTDSTGDKNIAIGFQAGADLVSGNNNIYIGNSGAANESLTIRLGTNQTRTFIAGIAPTNVNGVAVMIDANGQLGVALSSARYKRDIAPLGARSAALFQLRPVSFAYHDDAPGITQYGLIAEEVAVVYPELVTHTLTGEVQSVRYQELIPLLLNELQRQHRDIRHRQQAMERQQRELSELRALVEQRREPTQPAALISGSTAVASDSIK